MELYTFSVVKKSNVGYTGMRMVGEFMPEKFKTVLNEGIGEIVEKKSRFIANACQVKTEEQARAFIEKIKKKYWDARHNAFAYQIGEKNEIQRFSDDGEPQGTAGMPILNVLSGEEVKNCCIVVTRYFGGTLLGTGGLVRAYGKSAKAALLDAGIAEINTFRQFSLVMDYSLQGKIQYAVINGGHIIKDIIFTDKVELIVLAEDAKADMLEAEITDISSGLVKAEFIKFAEVAMINGKMQEPE